MPGSPLRWLTVQTGRDHPLRQRPCSPCRRPGGARGGSTSCRKPAGSLSAKAGYRSRIRESPGGQRGDMGLKDARGPPEEVSATPAHPAGTHSPHAQGHSQARVRSCPSAPALPPSPHRQEPREARHPHPRALLAAWGLWEPTTGFVRSENNGERVELPSALLAPLCFKPVVFKVLEIHRREKRQNPPPPGPAILRR